MPCPSMRSNRRICAAACRFSRRFVGPAVPIARADDTHSFELPWHVTYINYIRISGEQIWGRKASPENLRRAIWCSGSHAEPSVDVDQRSDPLVDTAGGGRRPQAVAAKPPTFARFCASAMLPAETRGAVRRAPRSAKGRASGPKSALWIGLRGRDDQRAVNRSRSPAGRSDQASARSAAWSDRRG